MKNMMSMMKQAQKLQAKMVELQAEVGNRTVSAQAGGGMVEAVSSSRAPGSPRPRGAST